MRASVLDFQKNSFTFHDADVAFVALNRRSSLSNPPAGRFFGNATRQKIPATAGWFQVFG